MALTVNERAKRWRDKKAPGERAKYLREWRAKNKDKTKKHNQTQKEKGNHARYWKGAAGKATAKRGYEKKMADPGRRLMLSIGSRITKSITDQSKRTSTRLKEYTEFFNSDDVRNHFGSQFEDWMHWGNYGPHNPNGIRTWNIGHHIPLSKFDSKNKNDVRRCWSKANLFPQEAQENNQLVNARPLPSVLESLRHLWPIGWDGRVPTKWTVCGN